LHCSNDPVLDFLPQESAPAGPFETMIVGRIGETALHQMPPPPQILFGRGTSGLGLAQANQLGENRTG
jgi:hypothetical protein